MIYVRVHATVAKQTHEMQLTPTAALHGLLKERHTLQLLIGDEQIDARDVHVHDSAGADIEVADFAVAHLAFGEANEGAGGVDQRIGKFLSQCVVRGLARQGDGVAFGFRAEAPAIKHGEYDWFRSFGHSWLGYRTRNFLVGVNARLPKKSNFRVSSWQSMQEDCSSPAVRVDLREAPAQPIPQRTA